MRNHRGAYETETWTSISDVGREINGHVLGFDEYSAVEDSYIDGFLRFADASGAKCLRVLGLEYGEGLQEGQELGIDDAADVLRRILRQDAWCRLEANDGSFAVHAGNDYYMFIGSNDPSTDAVEVTGESGLFVESGFVSPFIPEAD